MEFPDPNPTDPIPIAHSIAEVNPFYDRIGTITILNKSVTRDLSPAPWSNLIDDF